MGFSDYNANPDLNTSISGVNIGEGCPPSGINNAIRQIMADAKTADGGYVKGTTSSGVQVVSGGMTVVSGGITTSGNVSVTNGKADSTAHQINLGANDNGNAGLWDVTKNRWLIYNDSAGATVLNDGPVNVTSSFAVGGSATFSGGMAIRRPNQSSHADFYYQESTGSNTAAIRLVEETDAQPRMQIGVRATTGSAWYNGPQVWLLRDGGIKFRATDYTGSNPKDANFTSDGVFYAPTFSGPLVNVIKANGSAVVHIEGQVVTSSSVSGYAWEIQGKTNGQRGIYDPQGGKWALVENSAGSVVLSGTVAGSSDERLKGGIATIPDKTLDAWSKVDWRQYRYKADGAGAPVHFGVVAQHVSSCLAEGGVNPSGYALIENKALTEGGKDEWAVYYQEAFALEAAYQRRRADKAEERIAALERRLDALEAAFLAVGA